MKLIIKLYPFIFLFLPLFSIGQTDLIDSITNVKIDHESENPVHSILLYLENLDKEAIYSKIFGNLDPSLKDAPENYQFKIASSTKLFVATLILQLAEEGKLNLNDKASQHLYAVDYLDFDNFHQLEEKIYSRKITIEQLLSHHSGLADIFSDRQQEFFSLLVQNPEKQFSPKSIIELYHQFNLNKESHFEPGKGWYYSDMNYVLLGLIIEHIDQTSLAESIRTRILEPLEMKDTYFEYYEEPKQKKSQINQYVGSINFTEINTSFDWAGGGLVSTNKDLAIFIKALFNLELINKESLQNMIDVTYTKEHESRYGLGVYESEYNGNTYFGHYGFYETYIGYCPETKTLISYCISQASADFNVYKFINEVLQLFEGKN
ncbi:MAG: serine hydrolase domain-containing protein [Bacteroidota bacterium]